MNSPEFSVGSICEFTVSRPKISGSTTYLILEKDGTTKVGRSTYWEYRTKAKPSQCGKTPDQINADGPIYCKVDKIETKEDGCKVPRLVQMKPQNPSEWTPPLEPFDDIVAKMEEDEATEKKTSLVFVAGGDGQPNAEEQLGNRIMKVVAGMMNQHGGWLYVGVHDKNGSVTGIDNDLPHMKLTIQGTIRQYNGYDGWVRMFQDCVKDRLGQYAFSRIVPILRRASNGAVIGCFRIMPCRNQTGPVFLNDSNKLFVRFGSETAEMSFGSRKRFVSQWADHLASLPPPETDSPEDLYLSVWDTGDIAYREKHRTGSSAVKRIPIPTDTFTNEEADDKLLCFVYGDATISIVALASIKKDIQRGRGIATGAVGEPTSIIGAFCTEPDSFVYVKTRWQREVDGFKVFRLSSIPANEPGHESARFRMLDNTGLELTEAHAITGNDIETFVKTHGKLTRTRNSSSLKFTNPGPADFGYLDRYVFSRIGQDLLRLARGDTMPPGRSAAQTSWMIVSRDGKTGTVRLRFRDHLPEETELVDVEFFDFGFDDDDLSEPHFPSHVQTDDGYELLPKPVPVFGGGKSCFVFVSEHSVFPEFQNAGEINTGNLPNGMGNDYLAISAEASNGDKDVAMRCLATASGCYHADLDDWLVLLVRNKVMNIVLESRDFDYSVGTRFVLCKIEELQTRSEECRANHLNIGDILGENTAIVGSGVLPASAVSSTIENWCRENTETSDPRCPVTGFSPSLWIETRDLLSRARVFERSEEDNALKIRNLSVELSVEITGDSSENHLPADLEQHPAQPPITLVE